jgi:hypothetical protein
VLLENPCRSVETGLDELLVIDEWALLFCDVSQDPEAVAEGTVELLRAAPAGGRLGGEEAQFLCGEYWAIGL